MCAMKISVAFCLALLIITVTQFGASKFISNGGNEEITTENGTDILITKPEFMEVVVSNHELTFEVCTMNCTADSFLVCYESDPPKQKTTEFVDGTCDTCGFYVTGDQTIAIWNDTVRFMDARPPALSLTRAEECDVATMKFDETIIRESFYESCNPKIENGLIKLNVTMASSDCPVTIKNAKFKYHPTTTVLPSNNDSSTSSSGKSAKNSFGIFGWIFVLSICIFQ